MAYQLHIVDYFLFFGVLVISVGIGVYFAIIGRKTGSTKEYLTGGSQLSLLPTSISIVVSYMSAISMLGDPAESYMYGAVYLWNTIAICIGSVLANVLFVPVLYPLQLTSANKYFEMRYNSNIPKLLATFCAVLRSLTYSGVAIYAPATAISLITGFPTTLVVLVCACVGIIYTSLGGLKAVIWTDVFQAFIMIVGVTTILIMAIIGSGGMEENFNLNREGGRLDIFNLSPDLTERVTMWNTLVGGSFFYAMVYGTAQPAVMRYSGMKSLKTAQCSLLVVLVGNLVISQIPLLAGLALYGYYAHIRCDPISSGIVDSPNQLVSYFVVESLNYPGVPGLFTAALCAAALSTVSSVLNAACALTWDDLFQPKFPHMAQWKATFICKIIVLVYGVVSVGISFLTMGAGGTVLQASLSLGNSIGVPVFGLVLVGVLCPWVNWQGAVAGSISSFTILVWIMNGSYTLKKFTTDRLPTITDMCNVTLGADNFTRVTENLDTTTIFTNEVHNRTFLEYIYGISFLWYPLLGCIIFFLSASVVSILTGCTRGQDIDPHLYIPCITKYFLRSKHDKKTYIQVTNKHETTTV